MPVLVATGIEDFGYSFALIGSASMGLPSSHKTIHDVSYEGARHGMTVVDGGGTRFHTIMGAMLEGQIDAYKDGYRNFNHLGIRVPICSRREGALRALFEQAAQTKGLNLQYTAGDENSFHSVINETFHFLTYDTLAERQHPILGVSNAVVMGVGGFGTQYEMLTTALNNLYIKRDILKNQQLEAQGHPKARPVRGTFPGFKTQIKPIFADNAIIGDDANNRFYDFMHDIFTYDELSMMDLEICDHGAEEIFESLKAHANENVVIPGTLKPHIA